MNQENHIHFIANGKEYAVDKRTALPHFLESINLSLSNVVIERNKIALSPAEAQKTIIEDGDSLEIARIVAGG